MDYGQFAVSGAAEADADGGLGLAEQALASSQQVADNGHSMLVLSPHQNNFSIVVTVERWDGPPPDDVTRWEEAVEGGLVVDAGLTLSSPTMDYVSVPMPAGDYVMRVVGRGFVARGWPGSTDPGDTWRIQLWPRVGTTPVPLRRLATWKG
jgi:hypothetical protein